MLMEKYSKFSNLTKTFAKLDVCCGLPACGGLKHGPENLKPSGTTCEHPMRLSSDRLYISPSAQVNVRLWELEEYRDHNAQYPALIAPEWINGQLARTTVSIGENRAKVWATIDLAKVCTLNAIYYEHTDIILQ